MAQIKRDIIILGEITKEPQGAGKCEDKEGSIMMNGQAEGKREDERLGEMGGDGERWGEVISHCGPEQPKIHTEELGHSLVRLLVCSHRSLVGLLQIARFARALRCAHWFARLLTSLTPSLVGND